MNNELAEAARCSLRSPLCAGQYISIIAFLVKNHSHLSIDQLLWILLGVSYYCILEIDFGLFKLEKNDSAFKPLLILFILIIFKFEKKNKKNNLRLVDAAVVEDQVHAGKLLPRLL